MNIQPLELYGNEASFGGGMKLLNRTYDGPLIRIIRDNDDAPAEVFPDNEGKISLNSYVEVGLLISNATNLGEFLHQPGYTPDSKLEPTNVSASIAIIYDQSPNLNHFEAVGDPKICYEGQIFTSLFGMEIITNSNDFSGSFVGNSPNQSFSFHMIGKPQFVNTNSVLLSTNELEVTNKVQITEGQSVNLLTDETTYFYIYGYNLVQAVNQKNTSTVLVDEDYIKNWEGDNKVFDEITIESPSPIEVEVSEKIVTIEATVQDNNYSETGTFSTKGIVNRIHSFIIYNGVGNATRRHKTNQILVEGIPNLENQLIKFSPASFYNTFYGAKGIYSCMALAGLNNSTSIRMIQAQRGREQTVNGFKFTNLDNSARVDVYQDNSGQISLESPVVVAAGSSNATKLGEFLNATGYENVDNLDPNIDYNGYTRIIYDQSIYDNNATSGPVSALLYRKAFDRFEPYISSTEKSVVRGFNFNSEFFSFPAQFTFENNPFPSPKSIIFVFANSGTTKIQSQLGGYSIGSGYFSRTFAVTNYGITIDGPSLLPTRTSYGLDTNVHIVGISLGDNPTFQIDNEDPINFTITSVNEFKALNQLGPLYGTLLATIVYDEDRVDDFPEIFQYLNAFFGVENNEFPENIVDTSFNGEHPGASYLFSTQNLIGNITKAAKFSIPAASNNLDVYTSFVTQELYNQDIIAVAQENDANIIELYNQLNPFSSNYLESTGIPIYTGSDLSITRTSNIQAITISPTQSGELFTTQNKISLSGNFSMYVVGEAPTENCNLLGDGTCSLSFAIGGIILNTTNGLYGSISTLSPGQFFILEITKNNTNLIIGINTTTQRDSRFAYIIPAEDAFEFDTVFGDSSTDTTAYTGTLQSLIIYETDNFSHSLITKLYQTHKQNTYPSEPAP